MATIKINRVSPSFESNSGDEFESSAAAKDWLSADGLLNIEKLLQLDKKVTAQLKKVSVEAKPIGRGGRTVQFEVAGKKAAVARALRGRFPRKNPENVSIDVVEVPRSEGSMWRARIQVPAGSTITPKLRAEVSKLLTDVQEVKPTAVIAMSAKAKTAKYTAANDKKKDNFTYRSRRAVKVSERTRETATSRTLIRVFPKGLLPAAMQKQCEEALKAAQSHIKKIEKVKQGIQKDREKVRDQKAADYVKVVDEVMPMLEAQGIKANKMVLGKTMMGQQTLYVQLPSKQVITIGLSDVKAMRAASKLASESAGVRSHGMPSRLKGTPSASRPIVMRGVSSNDFEFELLDGTELYVDLRGGVGAFAHTDVSKDFEVPVARLARELQKRGVSRDQSNLIVELARGDIHPNDVYQELNK